MLSYGCSRGKGAQGTSRKNDPSGPEGDKVVPLFPEREREELVPIGSATESSNGGWSERRTAEFLDPNAQPMSGALRRPIRVALGGLSGAVLAAAGLALAQGDVFSTSPKTRISAHETSRRATTSSRFSTQAHAADRFASQPRAADQAKRLNRRSAARRHHVATPTSAVQVSYRPAATGSSAPTEGSSYQPPSSTIPPQQSAPATASAASGGSASQPAHPSPTGALTCISNCG